MNGSLFLSIPRALHFAYLIQAYEAAPESLMAKALRQIVGENSVHERRFKTIDFSGLSALEIRAECAGIRAAVVRLLSEIETAVIQARFGLTEYEDIDGKRRFAYSQERIDALKAVASYARVTWFPDEHLAALDVLCARHLAHGKTTPIPLRLVAEQLGGSKSHWGRRATDLGKRLDAIEVRAMDALMPYFEASQHGVSIV